MAGNMNIQQLAKSLNIKIAIQILNFLFYSCSKFEPITGSSYVFFFDQCLNAAHPKCWQKSSFSAFFCPKKMRKKGTNLLQNLAKKRFFKFAPKRWSNVLFPKLQCFTTFYRQKRVFKRENLLNLGIKHSTSVLVQT